MAFCLCLQDDGRLRGTGVVSSGQDRLQNAPDAGEVEGEAAHLLKDDGEPLRLLMQSRRGKKKNKKNTGAPGGAQEEPRKRLRGHEASAAQQRSCKNRGRSLTSEAPRSDSDPRTRPPNSISTNLQEGLHAEPLPRMDEGSYCIPLFFPTGGTLCHCFTRDPLPHRLKPLCMSQNRSVSCASGPGSP